MITILDYGAGNVRSVINAVQSLGQNINIVKNASDILNAEKLIFPGVGHYGNMIKTIKEKGYFDPLKTYLKNNRPFLGICLGFHALFETSDEFAFHNGLAVMQGNVKRFNVKLAVPHIGWNSIKPKKASPLFYNIAKDTRFYFVHSYHVVPAKESDILTTTPYENEFVSAVSKGNITGVQFHPEKSGEPGLQFLSNFISLNNKKAINHQAAAMPDDCVNLSADTENTNPGLAKRIVACLDVRSNDTGDLVVTKGDQYDVREKGDVRNLGKPVELARNYYEQGADEITFLNITGFRDFPLKDMPMIDVLKKTSENVFVPLTIGGGIRDYTDSDHKTYKAIEVAEAYFRAGADKISIGSDAVDIAEKYIETNIKTGTSSIEEISSIYGSQAVVISIDPIKVWVNTAETSSKHSITSSSETGPSGEKYCWYQCTVKGGREKRNLDVVSFAKACETLGAGELLINSIDKDGTNSGFDLDLINLVKNAVSIPVIASSGAGKEDHFYQVFTKTESEAALAAGIFHRKEIPINAVKMYLSDNKIKIRKN
ncbi:MAG: imidazole glycerol phosphate synthase subunit HisF [Desulfobacteraceae bacterium]|nr:imidazole glycerol phosphate synthase subunit HisF [Desulfobacteraceae bacterium]